MHSRVVFQIKASKHAKDHLRRIGLNINLWKTEGIIVRINIIKYQNYRLWSESHIIKYLEISMNMRDKFICIELFYRLIEQQHDVRKLGGMGLLRLLIISWLRKCLDTNGMFSFVVIFLPIFAWI